VLSAWVRVSLPCVAEAAPQAPAWGEEEERERGGGEGDSEAAGQGRRGRFCKTRNLQNHGISP